MLPLRSALVAGFLIASTPVHAEDCNAPGLAGLGLENDYVAAAHVKTTPKSVVETGQGHSGAIGAQVNATDNAYYYNHKGARYASTVAQFHTYWPGDPIMVRVDGACNLGPHPTTAEILQWAAHKWGLSPVVEYAEASTDGNWNMLSKGNPALPDYGCSVGVDQLAVCNPPREPGHAMAGLAPGEPGHDLAINNTCFNADVQASFLYRFYSGASGYTCSKGKLPIGISKWYDRKACAVNNFGQRNCRQMSVHYWEYEFFNGQRVPY